MNPTIIKDLPLTVKTLLRQCGQRKTLPSPSSARKRTFGDSSSKATRFVSVDGSPSK